MRRAGAGIRSLAEPFLDTTPDFAEIVLAILGVATKPENRFIMERTARGRADAEAKRVKFGRKPERSFERVRQRGSGNPAPPFANFTRSVSVEPIFCESAVEQELIVSVSAVTVI